MKGDREQCLAAGMDGYLSKPISSAELFAAIHRILTEPSGEAKSADGCSQVDASALLVHFEGDKDLLKEVIQLFREYSPQLLGEIERGIAAGCTVEAQRAAHSLKGALGAFGYADACQAVLHLEQVVAEGDAGKATPALDRVKLTVAVLDEAFTRFLNGRPL